jgi:hypothetical protein
MGKLRGHPTWPRRQRSVTVTQPMLARRERIGRSFGETLAFGEPGSVVTYASVSS